MNISNLKSLRVTVAALIAVAGLTFPTPAQVFPTPAQMPQKLRYQGLAQVRNAQNVWVPFAGPTGRFKFALINGSGSAAYWSNDDTHTNDASEPTGSVPLPVNQGAYTVMLGDTTLPNMKAISPAVFVHSDVSLRVWFSAAANGPFVKMEPDVRFASAGYAHQAAATPGLKIQSSGDANESGTSFCHSDNKSPDTLTMQVPRKGRVFVSAFADVRMDSGTQVQLVLSWPGGGPVISKARDEYGGTRTTLHLTWVIDVNPGPLNIKTFVFVGDPDSCATFFAHRLTAIFFPATN